MSAYDPPDEVLTIYNPINFFYDTGAGISQSFADLRYLKKAGDTATGLINFANGILANDGSNASPPMSFISDSNTGIYRIGADNLGISCGGVKQIDISTTATTFTNPVLHPNGTGLNAGIGFATEVNTGMYISGAALYFVKGATNLLRFQSSELFSEKAHNFITGTATFPSIRAASYNTTGVFWKATPSFCITTGGTERLDISSNGSAFSNQIQGKVGAVNDPSFSWFAEQNSGLYRAAANDLRFSVAGISKFRWTSTANVSDQQLDMNSNNIINAPKVSNTTGNLELAVNSTGAGGTITLTGGTDLLQATAGGSAGLHLKLTINGVAYKIALLNV